jgi:MscS family membrane protein
LFATIISLHKLKFPRLWNEEVYWFTVKDVFHAVATIILLGSFIWLLLRVIDFIATILEQKANLTADQTDNQLIVFFRDFLKVIIGISGLLMILHFAFNFDVSSLLTGLSIVGAAIALSLRESLENLIASFIIFFDRPFTTGDTVKVQNITGTVEKIGLRSTRIRTDQKTFVTVPNKQMVDTILDNLSLRTQRKGELRLEISLETNSQTLQDLMKGIREILSAKGVTDSEVHLESITGKAFLVYGDYFTPPVAMSEYNKIKNDINTDVIKLMESKNIQIAGADTNIRIMAPGQ